MIDTNDKISDRNSKTLSQNIIDEIVRSIQQINYGEVMITIHNSKVVQIEKREKKRF